MKKGPRYLLKIFSVKIRDKNIGRLRADALDVLAQLSHEIKVPRQPVDRESRRIADQSPVQDRFNGEAIQ